MPRWAVLASSAALILLLLSWLPLVGGFFLVIGGLGLALIALALLIPKLKPQDPLSLQALREYEERQSWQEAETLEIDPEADVVCPSCGTVRASVFPICPRCKR